MAYTPANLSLVIGTVGGVGSQVWSYFSTDAGSAVDASGYITDGGKRGMRKGDMVIVTDTDAATDNIVTIHGVDSVSATYPGAVDLTDAYSITSTD